MREGGGERDGGREEETERARGSTIEKKKLNKSEKHLSFFDRFLLLILYFLPASKNKINEINEMFC